MSIASPTTLVVLITGAILVGLDLWWWIGSVWLIAAIVLLWLDRRDPELDVGPAPIERIGGPS